MQVSNKANVTSGARTMEALYILKVMMFIGAQEIDNTFIYPTLAECQQHRAMEVQLLDKLNESVLTGYATRCDKAADSDMR
jgi:hypothetical protein